MRYSSCALLSASLLAGCAGGPVLPATIKVPVPIPCLEVADLPKLPEMMNDVALLAMPDYKVVLMLFKERIILRDHATELAALLVACM